MVVLLKIQLACFPQSQPLCSEKADQLSSSSEDAGVLLHLGGGQWAPQRWREVGVQQHPVVWCKAAHCSRRAAASPGAGCISQVAMKSGIPLAVLFHGSSARGCLQS